MSNSAHPERSSDRSAESEPSWAELLDPAALERRLRDARERRAEAIRARKERAEQPTAEGDGNAAPVPPRPAPRAVVVPGGESDPPSRPGRPESLGRESLGPGPGPLTPKPLGRPGSAPPPAAGEGEAERPAPPASRGFPPAAALAARQAAAESTLTSGRGTARGEPGADAPSPRPGWARPAATTPPAGQLPDRAPPAARDPESRPRPPARSGWMPPRPAPTPAPERETAASTKSEARVPEAEPNSDETPAPASAKPIRPVSLEPPVPLFEPGQAQARSRGMGGFPAILLAIFLIGLLGGGAAVLFAPASFRARIAEMIAPSGGGTDEAGSNTGTNPGTNAGDGTISARPVPAPPSRQSAALQDGAASGTPPDAMTDTSGAPWIGQDQPAAPGLSTPGISASSLSVPRAAEPTTVAAADPFGELVAPEAPAAIGPLRLPELAPDQQADEAVAALPLPPAAEDTPVEAPAQTAAIEHPAPAAAPTETEAASTGAPEEMAEGMAVVMPAAPALATARISVNYPASAAGIANEIAAALRAAGAGAANAVPVGFSVSSTNVRYYHAQDRPAAEALAELASGAGPVETRDFTNFRPQPLPGIVEIWLSGAGSSGGGTATVRAPVTTTRTTARPPAPTASARDLEAEEVERMLLSREVERLLRQQGGTP